MNSLINQISHINYVDTGNNIDIKKQLNFLCFNYSFEYIITYNIYREQFFFFYQMKKTV